MYICFDCDNGKSRKNQKSWILIKIKSNQSAVELQIDIDRFSRWSVMNKLKLNIEKCHSMIFSNNAVPSKPLYFINGTPLVQQSLIKDLGVAFDDKVKFDYHIDSIGRKSYGTLGFIKKTTAEFVNQSCNKFLYNALVRSRLEYNTPVWNPYNITYINRIEKVQIICI